MVSCAVELKANLCCSGGSRKKIFFAGGLTGTSAGASNLIDIYDAAANSWSTAQLSQARSSLCAVAAGTKVLFAGGQTSIANFRTVDIYDLATNTWSTVQLSEPKNWFGAAPSGTKIFFAGGFTRSRNWFDITWITPALIATHQINDRTRWNNSLLATIGDKNSVGFLQSITIKR